jgi:orotate phosphoribosyltransferase
MVETIHGPLDRRLAAELLRIGAVSLRPDQPFTWASGLKSPIYCDNRLTLSYPDVRRRITEGFAGLIREQGLEPECIVGTATAGIPQAALLAGYMNLPMAYVRSAPKAHGQGRRIEGTVRRGQRVVVIEDLVSTGLSSISVVQALRQEAGADVLAVLAIFTYGLPQAQQAFASASTPLYTLTDYPTLLYMAQEQMSLNSQAVETLKAWQHDPEAWSKKHSAI